MWTTRLCKCFVYGTVPIRHRFPEGRVAARSHSKFSYPLFRSASVELKVGLTRDMIPGNEYCLRLTPIGSRLMTALPTLSTRAESDAEYCCSCLIPHLWRISVSSSSFFGGLGPTALRCSPEESQGPSPRYTNYVRLDSCAGSLQPTRGSFN